MKSLFTEPRTCTRGKRVGFNDYLAASYLILISKTRLVYHKTLCSVQTCNRWILLTMHCLNNLASAAKTTTFILTPDKCSMEGK